MKVKSKFVKIFLSFVFLIFFVIQILSYLSLTNLTESLSTRNTKHVVISSYVDIKNDFYTFFLPITSMAWLKIGYQPIVILVSSDYSKLSQLGSKSVEYLKKLGVKLIQIESVPGYEKMTCMISRLFIGYIDLLEDDDFVLTSDSDLIPIQKEFYSINKTDSIVILNANCCGSFEFNRKVYKMFPMSYIGMKKSKWRDLMGLQQSHKIDTKLILNKVVRVFQNLSLIKRNDQIRAGDESWFLDQKMVSLMISNYIKNNISQLELKAYQGTRLDRESFKSELDIDDANFEQLTDFHMFHENLFQNWNLMNLFFKKFFDQKSYKFVIEYYREYKEIKEENILVE